MTKKRWLILVGVLAVLFLLRAADQEGRDAASVIDTDGRASETPGTPGLPPASPGGTGAVDGAVLYNADTTGNFEVYRLEPDGAVVQLTNDPKWDSWWARPSPDGEQMLFYRTPAGVHDQDYAQTSLWLADIGGTGATEILGRGVNGWDVHGHAEWSPTGHQLVMFAGQRINPQIWVTDTRGQNGQQITRQGGTNIDPSWSPDGSSIVYIGCPNSVCFEQDQEVYTVPANGGGDRRRITEDSLRDNDPYFSPDGATIAFLTQSEGRSLQAIAGYWDIRLVPAVGGDPETLTDGEAITSLPRWTPDGASLLTHRLEYGSNNGFDLVRVDARTGAISAVLAGAANEEYPSP